MSDGEDMFLNFFVKGLETHVLQQKNYLFQKPIVPKDGTFITIGDVTDILATIPVYTTLEKFENATTVRHFGLCLRKTRRGNSHD